MNPKCEKANRNVIKRAILLAKSKNIEPPGDLKSALDILVSFGEMQCVKANLEAFPTWVFTPFRSLICLHRGKELGAAYQTDFRSRVWECGSGGKHRFTGTKTEALNWLLGLHPHAVVNEIAGQWKCEPASIVKAN